MTSKKIVLSALAALTIGSVAATAGDIKLYQDENGQVFTTAGEGRTELSKSEPKLASHASKLKFSGLTYIGYKYNDFKSDATSDTSNFEIRRGYFQLKAYLLDDPKSYYRVTFDLHKDGSDTIARAKYAYLFLNEILPSTGVELGLVHRPWHDYEEHNSWYFRDISKVMVEAKNGAHLSNSADFGFNFKTKTKYFDSEAGIFQGEGYHGNQIGKGMSFEWRATAHLLGVNGKDKQDTKTYFDVSFFGQYNQEHIETTLSNHDDLIFAGLHTVYNQPSFLVAAQYIQSEDTADNNSYVTEGSGYSLNAEFRLGENKEYRFLGRYDSWTPTVVSGDTEYAQNTYIAGFAWDQNHNVQWVANVIATDNDAGSSRDQYNGVAYMLTAQVEF
jgi:hypothetical protein